jgi:hypothetical protein
MKFDRPVRQVTDETRDTMRLRALSREVAKSDTLHAPAHNRMKGDNLTH